MPYGKAMFSSANSAWETPNWLFEELDREFHFDVDVCAVAENAKCSRYFTPEDDALTQEWKGTCWMNPPYGKGLDAWIRKAYKSAQKGATVVCLIPSRTDRDWWHDYCMRGEIRYIRGRIKFVGAKDNAPFASAVVIFRPLKEG